MQYFTPLALALTLSATDLSAHEYKTGDILVHHPIAYETPPTARAGGGYLSLTNEGETADRLIGIASSEYPMVSIHLSETGDDGVARMSEVDAVALPAGETVEFAPGGLHIMFMGLEGGLEQGAEIPATLTFDRAGEVEILFHVESRTARDDHMQGDHMEDGHMKDGDMPAEGSADHMDHSDHND